MGKKNAGGAGRKGRSGGKEKTSSILQRTLSGFQNDLKSKQLSSSIRRDLQNAVRDIKTRIKSAKMLERTLAGTLRDLERATSETEKRNLRRAVRDLERQLKAGR